MKNKPHSHKNKNLFKFEGFQKKLKDLKVNSRNYILRKIENDGESDTLFWHTIQKWRELNLTSEFQNFQNKLGQDVQSIAQLILNEAHIAQVFSISLEEADVLSLPPILHCLVGFARDIPDLFYQNHFYVFLKLLIERIHNHTYNHDIIETIFVCIVSLFTLLQKYLRTEFRKLYLETEFCCLFSNEKPWYINELAAQCLGNLMRSSSSKDDVIQMCFKRITLHKEEADGVGRFIFHMVKSEVVRKLHTSCNATFSTILRIISDDKKHHLEPNLAVISSLKFVANYVSSLNPNVPAKWTETWTTESSKLWPVFLNELEKSCVDFNPRSEAYICSLLTFTLELVKFRKGALVINFENLLEILTKVINLNIVTVSENVSEIVIQIFNSPHYKFSDKIVIFTACFLKNDLDSTIFINFFEAVSNASHFESILHHFLGFVYKRFSTGNDEIIFQSLECICNIIISKVTLVRCAEDLDSWQKFVLDFESVDIENSGMNVSKVFKSIFSNNIRTDNSNLDELILSCIILPHIEPLKKNKIASYMIDILNTAIGKIKKLTVSIMPEEKFESQKKRRKSEMTLNSSFNVKLESDELSLNLLFLISLIVEALHHILPEKKFLSTVSFDVLLSVLHYKNFRENVHLLKAIDIYLTVLKKKQPKLLKIEMLENIYHVLVPSLSSYKILVRQLVSHIFSLFKLDDSDVNMFSIMYQIESVSFSPLEFKERVRLLNSLDPEQLNIGTKFLKTYQQAPLLFLIGQLFINFKDLWMPVKNLISKWAYALDDDVFWNVWLPKLKLAGHFSVKKLCDIEIEDENLLEFENSVVDEIHKQIITHPGFQNVNNRPDFLNFRDQLWQSMLLFVPICEKYNKDTVLVFLDFLETELFTVDYNVAPTQDISCRKGACNEVSDDTLGVASDGNMTDGINGESMNIELGDDNVIRDENDAIYESENESETEFQNDKVAFRRVRKAPIKSLCDHLFLLSKFHNPKRCFKSKELEEIYSKFLSHPHCKVQKLSLDCIFSYNHKFLNPYKESLHKILDDKNFKNEVALFDISGKGEDETKSLKEEHRDNFMPYLMRIMYGKILTKTSSRSSGSLNIKTRKAIVLRFLAGANEDELKTFLTLTFEFMLNKLEGDPLDIVTRVPKTLDARNIVPLKRMKGALGTLEAILDKLPYLLKVQRPFLLKVVLFMLSYSSALLENKNNIHFKYHNALKLVRHSAIEKLIMFFNNFVDYVWNDGEIEGIFQSTVWPILPRLPNEGINSPTALLRLFLCWSEFPTYHLLFARHSKDDKSLTPMPYIIELLNHPKCSMTVVKAIYNLLANLLGLSEEGGLGAQDVEMSEKPVQNLPPKLSSILPLEAEAEKRNQFDMKTGECIVLACTDGLLQHMKKSLNVPKEKINLNNINLQVLIHVAKWIDKVSDAEQLIDSIIPILNDTESKLEHKKLSLLQICSKILKIVPTHKYSRSFLSMLSHINEKESRLELCKVIDVAYSNKTKKEVIPKFCYGLNSWLENTIDELDSETRMRTFRDIQDYLNSVESLDQDLATFLIHQNIWTITHSGDQSLAALSVLSLQSFLDALIRCNHVPSHFKKVFDQHLMPHLKTGLRDKVENVRDAIMKILGHAVQNCSEYNFKLKDMHKLSNKSDPDSDFFTNMSHIQRSRRARALVKFCENFSEGKISFETETITEFLLPIVSTYVFKEEYASDSNIIDASVSCIEVVAKTLPWIPYQSLLKFYLNIVGRDMPHLKIGVKVLEAILDAFHENVTFENAVNKNVTVENTENEKDVNDDPKSRCENDNKNNSKICKSSNRVYLSLTKFFIPQILKALSKKSARDDEHKLNKKKYPEDEDIKRIPLALALIKLLKKLPHEVLNQNVSGVFMKLISHLKSKAESIRREARNMLVKVMLELGGSYLHFLIKDMQSILTKGYQTHVLVFTLNSILGSLLENISPEHVSPVIPTIMELCLEDLFGDKAEEKDVTKLTAKIKEVKADKGYDIMAVLGQTIAVSGVSDLLGPLKEKLQTQDSKVVNKIICCLQKIGKGLVRNKFITIEHKSIFAYGILNEKIKALSSVEEIKVKPDEEKQALIRKDCFLLEPEPNRATKIPKISPKSTSHALVEFALTLLHSLAKHGQFEVKNPKHCGLLDVYVPLIKDCLLSDYPETSIQALHLLWSLIKFPLPSLEKNISEICPQMFVILSKFAWSGSVKGKIFELVQLTFKTFSLVMKELTFYRVSSDHSKVLLYYARNYLDDFNLHHASFIILTALIRRKVNVDELHSLMLTVREISIMSTNVGMADEARKTYYNYITNYSKSKKQKVEILSYFLQNISYELPEGRLSALLMLQDIIKKYSSTIFDQSVEIAVWLKLTIQLLTESATQQKVVIKRILKILFTKSVRKNLLLEKCIMFFEDDPLKSRKENAVSIDLGARSLLAQLQGSDYENSKIIFESLIPKIVSVLHPGKFALICEDYMADSESLSEARCFDSALISVLELFLHLLNTYLPKNSVEFLKAVEIDAWKYIEDHLLYPHLQVRLTSALILDRLFAAFPVTEKNTSPITSDKNSCHKLALTFCDQLKTESPVETPILSDLGIAVIRNLIYLIRQCNNVPLVHQSRTKKEKVRNNVEQKTKIKKSNDKLENIEEQRPVRTYSDVVYGAYWVLRKVSALAYEELDQKSDKLYVSQSTFKRECLLKLIAGVIVILNDELLSSNNIITFVVQHLTRELSDKKLPEILSTQTKEVVELLKDKIGVQRYSEEAIRAQSSLEKKRSERKAKSLELKIKNPELASKKKAAKHESKKISKKRKISELKLRPSKKRLKDMAMC